MARRQEVDLLKVSAEGDARPLEELPEGASGELFPEAFAASGNVAAPATALLRLTPED